jgi:hypothetical protein
MVRSNPSSDLKTECLTTNTCPRRSRKKACRIKYTT